MAQPVRWGILSTAKIGREKVIPAMKKSAALEVAAIASRDAASARRVADALGIPTAHGSYEALLEDPSIEVVYNPLPNHLHVPLTLQAAKAGKHVLCEKPMALTAAELEPLRPFASKVHIAEAFMVRHHPQWIEVRERIRAGEIGPLRLANVAFSYFNDDPANVRNIAGIGGGALYDVGCYAIAAGRWFFEAEPERVVAAVERDPRFGTDRAASGVLDFGAGRQLAFGVATQAVPYQRLQLMGTRGRIEIEVPFNAPQDAPCRYTVDANGALDGSGRTVVTLPVHDQYQLQAEAFTRQVREAAPTAAGLDAAVAQMRVIDALFASERSGRFEAVAR